jgi:hypothetical protein
MSATQTTKSPQRSAWSFVPGRTALGALISATGRALTSPRVLALFWLAIAIPAAFLVFPMLRVWDAELGDHPGASPRRIDQALDVDLMRLHGDVFDPGLGAAALFVFLAAAVLGGGLLAATARAEPFRTGHLLVAGVRHLPRNLRTLGLGLIAALLLGYGWSALDAWLLRGPLADVDPGSVLVAFGPIVVRWQRVLEALDLVAAASFLLVLFTAKVAMARLAIRDRRSAVGAWLRGSLGLVRHPLTAAVFVVGPVGIGFVGASLLGELQVRLLEAGDGIDPFASLVLGAVVGQLAVLWWIATVIVGGFLLAYRFAQIDGAAEAPRTVLDPGSGRKARDARPERVVRIPAGAATGETARGPQAGTSDTVARPIGG